MKKLIAICLLLLCSVGIFAGPFGIEMGWSYDEAIANGVIIINNLGDGLYLIEPPSKHSSFQSYSIWIDPVYGIYNIMAISDSIESSSNGYQLKSEYNKVKNQLILSYGKPTNDVDRLNPGSIWDEPQDFMMALKLQERILICSWDRSDKTNNIEIGLMATADSSRSGAIVLLYLSENSDTVVNNNETQEASVL